MDFTYWHLTSELASHYKEKYDSGPDSFMANWRVKKLSKNRKPGGITLKAWIYLAEPVMNYRVVIGKKPKSKKAVGAIAPALGTEVPVHTWCLPPKRAPEMRQKNTTINDIRGECLQLLIEEGYEKAQARDLVDRCQDLISTRYVYRPQVSRRLTLPDEPTKRCTSMKKWVTHILKNHPAVYLH